MKALIMSDSHGWSEQVIEVVKRHEKEVDVVFHCGDSELEQQSTALKNIIVVKGNCDFGSDFSEEREETVQGVKFYIAHGHHYNVKMSLDLITYRGEEKQADIVCFGHTHIATSFQKNGTVYINPGSLRLPIRPKTQTYCICGVEDETITVRFYTREGEEVTELKTQYEK
ncbi:metallophosphoesterase family protein [Bacillus solitudinis]|uniref:metallophosphoesterase family protein n=1 Tax=Bacillus solitudinis TaxID=2014074 RepID=UPI000C24AD33|nr:metallophosphoesterase [Bacillus solitudinis]